MPILHAGLANDLIWLIAAAAILGVLFRPWGLSEVVWAVSGAALLILGSLLSWQRAWLAVRQGTDVYLFLAGMMLLSELARAEGLFDWVAARAVRAARGSPRRLFALIYAVGIVVTAFLSNDATAVVLTPAVYAAARHARTEPLPYLLTCAFIANAASFLLPIANPANLLVYARHLPALGPWLARFALPSLGAIAATYFALRATQRGALNAGFTVDVRVPKLTRGAVLAACGIALTAALLLGASATGRPLGPPTFAAGALTVLAAVLLDRRKPWHLIREVSWGVLPLVAGLFVLVSGLARTGLLGALGSALGKLGARSGHLAVFVTGGAIAVACNVMNNLPVALIARDMGAVHGASLRDAMLIGVDLGPNLSVTGSLATILWLVTLRREKVRIDAPTFLKLGVLVMPPALLLALAAASLVHP